MEKEIDNLFAHSLNTLATQKSNANLASLEEKMDPVKKLVLAKILNMKEAFTLHVRRYEERMYQETWLKEGEGKVYLKRINEFNMQLSALLKKNRSQERYVSALEGILPNQFEETTYPMQLGLMDGSTTLLSKFFDEFPEVLAYFYKIFINKPCILEIVHQHLEETISKIKLDPHSLNPKKFQPNTTASEFGKRPDLDKLNAELKEKKFSDHVHHSTPTVMLMLRDSKPDLFTPIKVTPEEYDTLFQDVKEQIKANPLSFLPVHEMVAKKKEKGGVENQPPQSCGPKAL